MTQLSHWWAWLTDRPWLAVAAASTVVIPVIGRDQVLAWRHRRFAQNARWVTVAAPPEVAPESAAAFWTTLVGVLTPSMWRRRLYGTPHLGWEYSWTGRALAIRVWVPGTIPPGAVEAAVRAAWPAATVTTDPAAPPIPTACTDAAGGAHWPQQADTLPLRSETVLVRGLSDGRRGLGRCSFRRRARARTQARTQARTRTSAGLYGRGRSFACVGPPG